jgi:hypothetical protein
MQDQIVIAGGRNCRVQPLAEGPANFSAPVRCKRPHLLPDGSNGRACECVRALTPARNQGQPTLAESQHQPRKRRNPRRSVRTFIRVDGWQGPYWMSPCADRESR